MCEHEVQAAHARLYGEVARQLTAAALAFADTVAPKLSAWDLARVHAGIAAVLAASDVGREGAVNLLRDLAAAVERGEDVKHALDVN